MYDNNDFNNQPELENNENSEIKSENEFNQNNQEFKTEDKPLYPPPTQYVTYIPYGLTVETFVEREKIKKTANIIGGSLLILNGFSFIISLILSFMSLTNEKVYNFLSDAAVNQFNSIVISSILFTIPFILLFKCIGHSIRELVDFKKPEKESALPLFLFGIAFCAFSNMAVSIAGNLFRRFGINYEVDSGVTPNGIFGFILTFISTAIVPPLIEEFACRGLIMGSLRKFGDSFAIIVSSIIFGIMHGNFQQIPFAFLVGLVLAYITIKSGSIWLAIGVHAFNNALSVVFTKLQETISIEISNIIYVFLISLIMLSGLLAIVIFKKRNLSYSIEKSQTKSSEAQKYKWVFTSAAIIIFIVFEIVKSLSFFRG